MKFQTKIMLYIMLLLSIAFGIGNSILLSMSFQNSLLREQNAAYHTYQMLLYSLDAIDVSGSSVYADMHNTLYQLDAQSGGWLALRLKSGDLVVYNSGAKGIFRSDLDGETQLNQCSMQVFSRGDNWYLQMTGKFLSGDNSFTLDALYSLQALYRSRDEQVQNYRMAFCVVTLLGIAMSWLISHWLTVPLRKLSFVLRKITAGDLSCRAQIKTEDEIGALARDLNQMTGQLETNMEELKSAMRRQEEFMGSFAHELKTPMTAIIGYADLLRSQSLSQEELQESANYIFSEGRRLERLSLKLLELLVSKEGNFQMVPCRPKLVLEEVAHMMQPGFDRQQITFTSSCGNGICCLEPDLLRSLLVNLMDNARKSIDDSGSIHVEIEVWPSLCRILVRDTGRGIAPHELEHIQEPFYRVDKSRSRAQGGTGLGLALCREIVKLHHGTLLFESKPGHGTCVTAELKDGEPR